MNIIGHRGDKEHFKENTLNGFKSSLNNKYVRGIELDVVVTKDKKLILSHDMFYLDNDGKKHNIYETNYKELPSLDSEVFPTLEELLELYINYKDDKLILIEIKSKPSLQNYPLSTKDLIKKLHNLICKYNISNNVYIISFDYRVVKESKRQNKSINTGLILHRNLIPIRDTIKDLGVSIVVAEKDWITKEEVEMLNLLNTKVFCWTVNSKKEANRLIDIGVYSIITDKPLTLTKVN